MDDVLFGSITVEHAVRALGVLVALLLVKRLVDGRSNLETSLSVSVTCHRCRWTGLVSKYSPVCRRCGTRVGVG